MPNTYNSKVVLSNGTVIMDLTADTVTAADLLEGVTAHGKDGAPITGTCTYDADTSEDTAAGTMTNVGAQTSTITTKAQQVTIGQGYHDGSGKVSIASEEQAKIIANNIREGIEILGVLGTMSGSEGVVAQAKTATPTWSQQTISPDTGYTHLSQVTVNAIPIAYADNSAGGKTVTIG